MVDDIGEPRKVGCTVVEVHHAEGTDDDVTSHCAVERGARPQRETGTARREVEHAGFEPHDSKPDQRAVRRRRPVAGDDGPALGRRVEGHGDYGPEMKAKLLLHREAREDLKRTDRHPPTNQLDDVGRSRRRKAGDGEVVRRQELSVHDHIAVGIKLARRHRSHLVHTRDARRD